jgi:hypothetical protein
LPWAFLFFTEKRSDSRKKRRFFFGYAENEHLEDFGKRDLAFADFGDIDFWVAFFVLLADSVNGSDDPS